jgi:hypothetical protein
MGWILPQAAWASMLCRASAWGTSNPPSAVLLTPPVSTKESIFVQGLTPFRGEIYTSRLLWTKSSGFVKLDY